jgi:esterase/lipase
MVWDFKQVLARRLLLWAFLSLLIGAGLSFFGDRSWLGFGIQAVIWGMVNTLLAWGVLQRAKRRLGQPFSQADENQEAGRFRKALWIGVGSAVVIIFGGVFMAFFLSTGASIWRGTGWGLIVQGFFLFFFTLWHVFRVPDPFQLPFLPLFTHPDHKPFTFEGGKPAALLVHGFPGTALEMRPLGEALNNAGWTSRGICLPGFGPDLVNIINFNNTQWVDFVCEELEDLRLRGHHPLMLVGYSFGGTLALQAAARTQPDALTLIAPATWQEPPWATILLNFVRALLPLQISPFRYTSVQGRAFKDGFAPFLPELDFDDPDQMQELEHLQIPLIILDQVREVGRNALKTAPQIQTPTLLIRGTKDPVIRSGPTDRLVELIPGSVKLEEVTGPHSLTMPHNPAFTDVAAKVIAFAAQFH